MKRLQPRQDARVVQKAEERSRSLYATVLKPPQQGYFRIPQFLMGAGLVCAVVAAVYVLRPSSSLPVTVSTLPLLSPATPCVGERIHLFLSNVKDRVDVFVDNRLVGTVKYGMVGMLKPDGSGGQPAPGHPGVGNLDLTPYFTRQTGAVRVVGHHLEGSWAGVDMALFRGTTQEHANRKEMSKNAVRGAFYQETINVQLCPKSKAEDL